jgi:fibronectin type 3 domain-containing protein
MKNKKVGFVISILFFGLALVAVYQIAVISGFFKNKDTATETRQTHRGGNPGTDQVTLAWDAVQDATSYNVYWNDASGVKRHNGRKVSTLNNSAIIKGLKHGTTYYFVVTAVNASGESKESEELSFRVGE